MHNDRHSFRRFGSHERRFSRPDAGDDSVHHRGHRAHGHGRHGHGHRGGGLGRFFAHGDLRLVVLSLIGEAPRHGYELIKAIEESVGGAYSPSPGVIYPTLTLLDELGYVTTTEDGSKKRYAITDEGTAYLAANRKTLDALQARIRDTGASHRTGASPQIIRAMENLKLALRLRLERGALADEQITAVAAAIDAAALAVEKV